MADEAKELSPAELRTLTRKRAYRIAAELLAEADWDTDEQVSAELELIVAGLRAVADR